jgi:hypothetical protein
MYLNFFIFVITYIFIIVSILGYGYAINNFSKKTYITKNIGYVGLLGIFFLTIYSYTSSIFYSHNIYHNLIFLLIGSFFFFKSINFFKFFFDKNFKLLILIFLVLLVGLFIFKTHDDFSYYHFQYSYYLTKQPAVLGIGNFGLGLRTPSSLFYLNSLFYLPIIKYYSFQITPVLILGFSNLLLLIKIKNNIIEKKYNFLTVYNLLVFIFINIFFYRISEHGTDRSAQILILILFSELLLFLNFKIFKDRIISKILLLIGLVISFKAFYILYTIFFFIILIHFVKLKFSLKKIIYNFFSNYYFLGFIFLLILVLFHNFLISGCVVYPVSITCFDSNIWSIKIDEVNDLNNWYEQWSKAGAGPNFRVKDPLVYIQNFNWVNNWFDKYFFNKVSDYLVSLIFLIIIIFYSLKSKQIKIKPKRKIFLIISFALLLLFEWFYNHPSLRYGGYCLISGIVFVFFAITMEKYKTNYSSLSKKIIILILITLTIFISRNIYRVNFEVKKYNYKPFEIFFYNIGEKQFTLQNNLTQLIDNYEDCLKYKRNCNYKNDLNIGVQKKYGKYIFFKY